MILEACRRTHRDDSQPKLCPMPKVILERWYKNNVGSLEDVKRLDEEHVRKKHEKADQDRKIRNPLPGTLRQASLRATNSIILSSALMTTVI